MNVVLFLQTLIRKKTELRNGALFVFYAIINSGIGFLIVILMSRFIPPSEYGTLNLFTTLMTIISIIVSLGTISYPSIDFFRISKKETAENYSVVFSITIIVSIFILFCFLSFKSFFVTLSGLSIGLLLTALFMSFLQQVIGECLNIFRLEEKVGIYGVLSVGNGILSCLFTFVLIVCFHYGWMGRIYSLVLVTCLLVSVSIIAILRKRFICITSSFLQKKLFKNALSYGLPLVPHSLSWWLKQGADRFIINYFHGSIAVGLFSFAFNFANILVIVAEAFNASYSVTIYKQLSQNNDNDAITFLLKKNYYILCFYLFISFFIMLVTHFGIPFFFPKYSNSLCYIYPLCLSAFFQSVYYLFVNFIFFKKKTKLLMFITFGSAVSHLLLSVIFTRIAPLFAAYLLLFTNILISVCVILYVNYLYNLPWKRAYKLIVK